MQPPWRNRIPLIGVRSISTLHIISKRLRKKSLFVSRFSPDISEKDIEKSLLEQLKLALLTCTRLKAKFKSYASFHISVNEDDFPLINNTGVPFVGRLNPE
jgi:hypothetical protein